MAIVELSQSLDNLARAIVDKNKELDEMKIEYERKLRLINGFLEKLSIGDAPEMSDAEFLESIQKDPKCPSCSTVLEPNYLWVPTKKITIPQHKEQPEETPTCTTIRPGKKQNSSKRICSYCKEHGHSRAKCWKRLTTPKE